MTEQTTETKARTIKSGGAKGALIVTLRPPDE